MVVIACDCMYCVSWLNSQKHKIHKNARESDRDRASPRAQRQLTFFVSSVSIYVLARSRPAARVVAAAASSRPLADCRGHVAHRANSRRYRLLTPGDPKLYDGSKPTGQGGLIAPRATAGDPKTLWPETLWPFWRSRSRPEVRQKRHSLSTKA